MRYNKISLRDYNSGWEPDRKRSGGGLRWALLGTVSGLALGLFSLTSFDANALKIKDSSTALAPATQATTTPGEDTTETLTKAPQLPQAKAEPQAAPPPPPGSWHEVTVQAGDSLARIFSRQGISPRQLHDIIATGGVAKKLTDLYPGQKLRMRTTPEDGLLELVYEIDALNQLQVLRKGEDYESQLIAKVPERHRVSASGRIDNSLFLAANRAGLPDKITMELANIFGWDIDFALDIRRGDRFTVIYEELYLDGERIGTGDILAAEFVNDDEVHQAVAFTDDRGHTEYYDPKGRSMRKAFLRTPVAFTRISSRFSLGRKHPILNRIRAHKGVDYAAPRGTPVKATGNGKIVFRGRKGGYGNTLIIRHGNRYSTLYAHLSRFARGIKNGRRVRQGQVIAYVGSTGLATGPHLHYEFRVNGVHRNPLTVKLPSAAPLPPKYRKKFKLNTEHLLAQLELAKSRAVALQSD
ncbi:MAG TPA: peptidase M23 [Gammaproteobacteria bacterium]|nr:peptidase M23 [Gammaproteobacteria bacterium]